MKQSASAVLEVGRLPLIQSRNGPGRPTISNARLFDVALDLFVENGFEGTSIDTIASAAGIAKRTIYARFGNKKTFFLTVLTQAIDAWYMPVERLRSVECDDLEETLLNIARLMILNVLSPQGMRIMHLTTAESIRFPEISDYSMDRGVMPTASYIAELFGSRLGERDLRVALGPEIGVTFLNLVVSGVANRVVRGVHFGEDMIEAHIRLGVDLFLHGFLVSGSEKPGRYEARLGRPDAIIEDEFRGAADIAGSVGDPDICQENRLLRKLLIESILEGAALKEQLALAIAQGPAADCPATEL